MSSPAVAAWFMAARTNLAHCVHESIAAGDTEALQAARHALWLVDGIMNRSVVPAAPDGCPGDDPKDLASEMSKEGS